MSVISELLKSVRLPLMFPARQRFVAPQLDDVAGSLTAQLEQDKITQTIRPGMRVAIAVGSRGLAELPLLVHQTVEMLRVLGADPFIVPAMGSHGGATAEGQRQVLAKLGVTEESAGCKICSSMDVVVVGRLENGLEVFIDKLAYEADGIVVINRIKPHNCFNGPSESGLVKMITIGLGKQIGADSCHSYGFGHMPSFIVEMARIKLATSKILFGVGTVENAYDRIVHVEVVAASELIETDQRLLKVAKANMPQLPFMDIDVLVVDRLGKEFSGGGMDGNITGRYPTPFISGGPRVNKMVVLDVTDKSNGNTNGMGMADVTTKRLFSKIDYNMVYANALTSTITASVKIPMIMDNEEMAFKAAVKMCNAPDWKALRVLRIPDTLNLSKIYLSSGLWAEAQRKSELEIMGEPECVRFNDKGDIITTWASF